jgi:hypothetical protein
MTRIKIFSDEFLVFLQRLTVSNPMMEDLKYFIGGIIENAGDAKRVCCHPSIIRYSPDNTQNFDFPAFSNLLFLVRHDGPLGHP